MLKKIFQIPGNGSPFLSIASRMLLGLILLGAMNQGVIADNCTQIGPDYECTLSQNMYGCYNSITSDWGGYMNKGNHEKCFWDDECSNWASYKQDHGCYTYPGERSVRDPDLVNSSGWATEKPLK